MKAPTALCTTILACACFAGSSHSLRGAQQQKGVDNNGDLPRLLLQDLARKESQTTNDNAGGADSEPRQHPSTWAHDIFNGKGGSKGVVVGHDDDKAAATTTMGSYIIEFDDSIQDIQGAATIIANWLGRRPGHVFKRLVHGFSISNVPMAMVPKIESIEGVSSVELDEEISLDGELRKLEDGEDSTRFQTQQETPWGIKRVNGGRKYNGTSVVFVIDSGVDLDHPDLNVHKSLCFSIFKDGSCNDDNGHGTHVAGTIAAIDNGFGVVGVAAGATVVPVKIVDAQGRGHMGGLLQGIEWVTENAKKGDVCNISLSGKISQVVDRAVRRAAKKGIRFTLSAGNGSTSAAQRSPSRANHRNIFTIAAITQKDVLAWFSNTGKPPVDWSAPGVGVISTFKDGSYRTMDGTSMAAPHAAGALLHDRMKRRRKSAVDADGNRYQIVTLKK